MRLIIFFLITTVIINFVQSDDVCSSPFSAFLQCMADDADKKLGRYIKEVSPEVKEAVQDCFSKNGCDKPDFSQATLSYFLKEPWLSRASDILDLLENIDPKVKDCMMRYFLDVIRTKINDCVKTNGPDDVKDFEMPPLPDVHNIDITKFKEVVLNRLMVRVSVIKCNETKGELAENNTIDCIADARRQYDQTLCTTRVNCRQQKIPDQKCLDRFDKVHSAVCQCANSNTASNNARELLLSGKLEKEFKKCYDDNNLPYPEDKVKKVHQAVQQSAADILQRHQMPPEVKQTLTIARQALKDIEGQWKGAFCAECLKDGEQPKENDGEIEFLKNNGG